MPSSNWFIKNIKITLSPGLRLYGGHPRMWLAMDCDKFCGGGVYEILKKSMGTAINIIGMEDIENLCRKLLTGKLHSQNKCISDLSSELWYMLSLCFLSPIIKLPSKIHGSRVSILFFQKAPTRRA